MVQLVAVICKTRQKTDNAKHWRVIGLDHICAVGGDIPRWILFGRDALSWRYSLNKQAVAIFCRDIFEVTSPFPCYARDISLRTCPSDRMCNYLVICEGP